MRCANCAGRIELALNALDGVARVRTNPAQRRLVLDYDPNRVGLRSIFEAIEDGRLHALRTSPTKSTTTTRARNDGGNSRVLPLRHSR